MDLSWNLVLLPFAGKGLYNLFCLSHNCLFAGDYRRFLAHMGGIMDERFA